MIGFDEMFVLLSAKFCHSRRISTGTDHIPVIIHRFTVKLHQTAAAALAKIQSQSLISSYMFCIWHVLRRRRHII